MSTLTAPAPRTTSSSRAVDARRAVLLAEYETQRRALASREHDLALAESAPVTDADAVQLLRLCLAWHRDNLERLSERLGHAGAGR